MLFKKKDWPLRVSQSVEAASGALKELLDVVTDSPGKIKTKCVFEDFRMTNIAGRQIFPKSVNLEFPSRLPCHHKVIQHEQRLCRDERDDHSICLEVIDMLVFKVILVVTPERTDSEICDDIEFRVSRERCRSKPVRAEHIFLLRIAFDMELRTKFLHDFNYSCEIAFAHNNIKIMEVVGYAHPIHCERASYGPSDSFSIEPLEESFQSTPTIGVLWLTCKGIRIVICLGNIHQGLVDVILHSNTSLPCNGTGYDHRFVENGKTYSPLTIC